MRCERLVKQIVGYVREQPLGFSIVGEVSVAQDYRIKVRGNYSGAGLKLFDTYLARLSRPVSARAR